MCSRGSNAKAAAVFEIEKEFLLIEVNRRIGIKCKIGIIISYLAVFKPGRQMDDSTVAIIRGILPGVI